MSQVPLFILFRLLSSLGALALEALLLGVHCKKRYINVWIQYNTILSSTILLPLFFLFILILTVLLLLLLLLLMLL